MALFCDFNLFHIDRLTALYFLLEMVALDNYFWSHCIGGKVGEKAYKYKKRSLMNAN